ncbi:hypothetical protein MycrhDRAFT_5669 [Mycolicibacterium rhodesiae JS60]|nr:hypothetical protein MycrhDRAFT_5669 [Mycolicibacterium rhodesiae JS60]
MNKQGVLDEIAVLIDGQIRGGESTANEADDLYCVCSRAWHGLPIEDCPGTPAAGVWHRHDEFQGPHSAHPFRRHPALVLDDIAEEIAEWLADSSRELDYCTVNDYALETGTELTDEERSKIHRLVAQRLIRGVTGGVPGEGAESR